MLAHLTCWKALLAAATRCVISASKAHRVSAVNSAFQQLRQANIWSSRALTLSVDMLATCGLQTTHCRGQARALKAHRKFAPVS